MLRRWEVVKGLKNDSKPFRRVVCTFHSLYPNGGKLLLSLSPQPPAVHTP
jgi:hypothetical protein